MRPAKWFAYGMVLITLYYGRIMISKNEVKYIQSLSHKKNRDVEGVFIAETPKLVNELLQSNVGIKKLYATSEWQPLQRDIMVEEVDEITLARISQLETPNKVLAIAEKKVLDNAKPHFVMLKFSQSMYSCNATSRQFCLLSAPAPAAHSCSSRSPPCARCPGTRKLGTFNMSVWTTDLLSC